MIQPSASTSVRRLLWLALVLAAVLRVLYLAELRGDVPSSDEFWRMNVAARSVPEILETPFDPTWARYLGMGPWTYVLLIKPALGLTQSVSADAWLLRSLSLVLGLATVIGACWFFPRRLDGESAAGGALLIAAHPALLIASQDIKENALMALLASVAAFAALRWVESGARRHAALVVVAMGAAATLHPIAALTGSALLAVAAVLQKRPLAAFPWLVALGVPCLVVAWPIAYHFLYSADPAEVLHASLPSLASRIFGFIPLTLRELLLPEVPGDTIAFIAVLPLLVWGGWRARRERAFQLAFGSVALSLVAVWLVQLWRPTWVFPRYFTHLAPVVLFAAAFAFANLPRRYRNLGFALLLVPYLVEAGRVFEGPREGHEFRTAMAHLDRFPEPPVVIGGKSSEYLIFRYLRPHYRHVWLEREGFTSPPEWTTVFRGWPGAETVVNGAALGMEDGREIWALIRRKDYLTQALGDAGFRSTGEQHGCVRRFVSQSATSADPRR